MPSLDKQFIEDCNFLLPYLDCDDIEDLVKKCGYRSFNTMCESTVPMRIKFFVRRARSIIEQNNIHEQPFEECKKDNMKDIEKFINRCKKLMPYTNDKTIDDMVKNMGFKQGIHGFSRARVSKRAWAHLDMIEDLVNKYNISKQ